MPSDVACAVPLGSWCLGIPITLHYTFFLLLGVQLFNAIRQYDSFWYTLLIAILYGPVLLITIVFHELGHAWMNKRYGGDAERIVLWPLGGYVLLGRTEGLSVLEDFWVALAGPLTHIPQAVIWFGIFLIFEKHDSYEFNADPSWDFDELNEVDGFVNTLAEQAILLNAGLFVFNVFVPAYPLDGGRMLAALLVFCCCSVTCAAYTTSIVAIVLAGCMIAWGVYDIFIDDSDDADGGAPVLLILIGVWIAFNSWSLLRSAMRGKPTEHPLFSKECYRRRAGVDDPAAGSSDDWTPNNGSNNLRSVPAVEVPPSRRELREQKKQEKKQAREDKKRAKSEQQQSGKDDNNNFEKQQQQEPPSSGFGKAPPASSASQDFEPPPDDPMLSPAGQGTSWTTFHTTTTPAEPPPTFGDEPEKKSRFGRLFGKKSRPSQSAADDDFVV